MKELLEDLKVGQKYPAEENGRQVERACRSSKETGVDREIESLTSKGGLVAFNGDFSSTAFVLLGAESPNFITFPIPIT